MIFACPRCDFRLMYLPVRLGMLEEHEAERRRREKLLRLPPQPLGADARVVCGRCSSTILLQPKREADLGRTARERALITEVEGVRLLPAVIAEAHAATVVDCPACHNAISFEHAGRVYESPLACDNLRGRPRPPVHESTEAQLDGARETCSYCGALVELSALFANTESGARLSALCVTSPLPHDCLAVARLARIYEDEARHDELPAIVTQVVELYCRVCGRELKARRPLIKGDDYLTETQVEVELQKGDHVLKPYLVPPRLNAKGEVEL